MSNLLPGDSNGTPWQGRHFDDNEFAADDGAASPALLEALRRFRAREASEAAVVDVVRQTRLLIPLIARVGESGRGERGLTVDKRAELSIVTVAGPDGRNVMPVFSSVDAMRRWNPDARPVPADAVRVGLAAASERTDLVVLDPTSETEFVLRRPAVWAIAQGIDWTPSRADDEVLVALIGATMSEPLVRVVDVESGDPDARLAGPELVVNLRLQPGLDAAALEELLARLQGRWAASEIIAARVDSLAVRVLPS
jgi:hypothetical protein